MAKPFQDSIILFGDSITSRQDVPSSLHALMSDHYRRTIDVLNRGYGGYNTTFSLPLLEQLFAKKNAEASTSTVRLVTIWFGTNDAVLESATTHQHVPLDTYTANLHTMLEALTSPTSPYAVAHSSGLNILLITPPPFLPSMLPDSLAGTRAPGATKTYVDAVLKVGAEWKAKQGGNWRVATVDMWSAILKKAGGSGEELRPFFTDGLHLETKGYAVLWEEYAKIVKTDFKDRGLDWDDLVDLPPRVPLWDDVDYSDPQSVIKKLKLPPIRQN